MSTNTEKYKQLQESRLYETVLSFHDTLAKISNQFRLLFGDYPRGACGSGSEMLGYYLQTRHAVDTTYCNGETHYPRYQSHAWLEYGKIIVDITCCQFVDCPFPCPYVGIDNSWHGPWNPERRPIGQAIGGTCHWKPAYNKLLSELHGP